MKTLRQIIESDGPRRVARELGVSESYTSKIGAGIKPASGRVLGMAVEVYGRRLDIRGSIREADRARMGSDSTDAGQ